MSYPRLKRLSNADPICWKCERSIRWGTLVSGQRLPFDPHPVDLSDEDRAIVPLYRFEDGVARLTINHSDGREVYTMHLDTCEGALKVG